MTNDLSLISSNDSESSTKGRDAAVDAFLSSTLDQQIFVVNDNLSHVTKTAPYSDITKVPTDKGIANHIAEVAGAKIHHLPDESLQQILAELTPDMQYAVKETLDTCCSHDFNTNPLVEFRVEPNHLDSFNPRKLFDAYLLIQAVKISREIIALIPDLKDIRHKLGEYKEYESQYKAIDRAVVDAKYTDISRRITNAQLEHNVLARVRNQNSKEMDKLKKRLVSLEQQRDLLTEQLNNHPIIEEWLKSHPFTDKDQREYNKLHNKFHSLLGNFKIYSGTRLVPTSKTTGVLVYVKDEFLMLYDVVLKNRLEEVFSSKEDVKILTRNPKNYYVDVQNVFHNSELRKYSELFKILNEFDAVHAAWKASDVVATINIISRGDAPPVQGYALFHTHLDLAKLVSQPYMHFKKPADVKMEAVHYYHPGTPFPVKHLEASALILFSYTGNAPRMKVPAQGSYSRFIVLCQTKPLSPPPNTRGMNNKRFATRNRR